MKKTLFLAVVFLALLSCKKEEPEVAPANFAEIQLKHIQALEAKMSIDRIVISDATGVVWKAGNVYVYKTNDGRFGKFEVVSIDPTQNYQLTIKAVNYAPDGTIYNQSDALSIKGTWHCDLDLVKETIGNNTVDFQNERDTKTNTFFRPENKAKFVKYTFSK